MINYTEIFPTRQELRPYIESYVILALHTTKINTKVFLSRPGATLLVSSIPFSANKQTIETGVLLGISDGSKILNWKEMATARGLIVKFSPYGLSRFTDIPMEHLGNEALSASSVWGNSFRKTQNELMETAHVTTQIEIAEAFLMKLFIKPNEIDKRIFRIADNIKTKDTFNSLESIIKEIPLSQRQIERRFKALMGVNIQTFNRICHFENVKSLLMEKQPISLTEVGYQAGYYDQAHFIREFKRFTAYSPKSFFEKAPFYRYISKLND